MSLERRLEALETEIGELRAQLERRQTSMRQARRCPACGCRTVIHAKSVIDRGSGASFPLAVSMRGVLSPEPRGCFACYVCSACGLCEWYVERPDEIVIDGDTVAVLAPESNPEGGPYR